MPELERFRKRQTAYKTRIIDILNSEYVETEGFDPNYLEINDQEVSRLNVIGVVVQKTGIDNYKALTIDDGTGRISARIFENNIVLDKIGISDVVLIIGRPRKFSSEKYILIEAVKKVDLAWAKVRKLELERDLKKSGKIVSVKRTTEGDAVDLGPHNRVFKLIKELDKGDGVSVEDLSSGNIKGLDKIIDTLLKEGDVFEFRPGKLKVLE